MDDHRDPDQHRDPDEHRDPGEHRAPDEHTAPEVPAAAAAEHTAKADESPEIEQVEGGLVLEKKPRKPKKRRSRLKRFAIWSTALVVFFGLAGLGAVVGIFWHYSDDPEIPSFRGLQDYRPPLVTDVYSGDDQLIGEFYVERRRVVPYDRVPKRLVQAFIAVEDSRFFDHFGLDPLGMFKAVVEKLLHGGQLRGASTLTQQTAKAILQSEWGFEKATARTLRRKMIEMLLALRLEEMFTKEQILGIYLNQVALGHHSYGVQSAAENYFRKNVDQLTLGEMALLAGLPQAPSRYSPYVNPKLATDRRSKVLERMYQEGMITEGERDAANEEPVVAHDIEDVFRETAPFFTEHVRRYILDRYTNERLLNDGLEVYTTVDMERQRYAQESALAGLRAVDARQGYQGALYRVPEGDRDGFASTYDEKVLEKRPLETGATYVGLVEKVEPLQITVRVGRHRGVLPLVAMTWAHPVNPELYYPSALIDDCRKSGLKTGDAILVRRVTKEDLPQDPQLIRKVPKEGLLFSLQQPPELQAALVSLDPNSSYVVAMIGGLDFELSEYNRAFQACRQPGSAFKPIVYSAALTQLEWTPSTILVDSPIVFDDPDNELRWKPANYGHDFSGDVTLRNALVHSMNVPAIKVLEAVGIDEAVEWAGRLGITTELNKDLSIALGSSCVKLWDLTRVYALFNRYGKRVDPTFVRRVVDRDGRVLEDRTVYFDPWAPLAQRVAAGHARLYEEAEQVVPAETAYLTTFLMSHVVKHGTGIAATALRKPAAGKTGTTNDSFDAWFMGFTRDLVTGVWIGYDTYDHPMGRYENGGRSALPIWLSYMQKALEGREQGEFEPPPEVANKLVMLTVDLDTGKLAAPGSRRPKIDLPYIRGSEPTEVQGELSAEDGGAIELFIQEGGF